jgi:hypothetical protein
MKIVHANPFDGGVLVCVDALGAICECGLRLNTETVASFSRHSGGQIINTICFFLSTNTCVGRIVLGERH